MRRIENPNETARPRPLRSGASPLTRLIARSRGFTLTELLVVIAITTILLGLLFIPIIQGFNLTRKAQNESQAQGAARIGLEQITRELGQAAYVFDNANTPIAIPLNRPVALGPGGANTTLPHVLYGKIDFVASATSGLRTGDIVDPTTGKGLDGSELRLPLAPGQRVVRYFLGLKRNLTAAGQPETYANLYEFGGVDSTPRDTTHNPLILYRAEFDPADPNLFVLANYNSPRDGDGGFNDPTFFYNTTLAPNGNSYAANWRAIATPVVDGPHQDMLSWRRDQAGDLVPDAPMRTLVLFAPGTVVGDTATPGFLTSGAAEAPGAVPTLYSTREAQWVLPYTVTFYRASSGRGVSRPSYGALRLRFENEPQADGSTRLRVVRVGAEGSLAGALTDTAFYTLVQANTGRIFVKTPNLTFAVDPARGRVETGFPPLAGTDAGAPLVLSGGSVSTLAPTEYPGVGELIPVSLRLVTRDPAAGTGGIPTNQGIVAVAPLALGSTGPYIADAGPAVAGNLPSPLQSFGNVLAGALAPGGGLMIAPGTERVLGPDLVVGVSSLANRVAWVRAPGALASVVKKASQVDDALDTLSPARKRWSILGGQRTYLFDQDTQPNDGTRLIFDEPSGPGMPARAVTDPPGVPELQMVLTYLWQNNYARRTGGPQNGWPVDSRDNTLLDLAGGAVQGKQTVVPEPDVVKVDYSTRSQLVVNFGVNVYDTNTRRATTLQLNDRVKVGNLGR